MSENQEKKVVEREYYKALFLGASGSGKTYAMRNLNEETTGFLDYENKPLPFPKKFKYRARPTKLSGAIKALEDYIINPEISLIMMDSGSSFYDFVLEEVKNKYVGYDIWSNYNTEVSKMFRMVKNAKKEVFITSHYEILNIEGDREKRAKVKGKEWEGLIEKEFTIVLYAEKKFKEEKGEYSFRLAGEGMSAKTPPGIFKEGESTVPSDYDYIYKKIVEFATPK